MRFMVSCVGMMYDIYVRGCVVAFPSSSLIGQFSLSRNIKKYFEKITIYFKRN